MKLFRFGSIAAMSLLMTGVLAGQAPQTPPAQPPERQTAPRPSQPATQPTDAAEMTIVGCLAQSASATDAFTLNVVPATDAQKSAAATPGTTPDATRATNPNPSTSDPARTSSASAAAMSPTSYKIVGISADQLKPHVNHQVELKGKIDTASSTSTTTTSASSAKEFRATSVKMLSATCPPAK